MSRFEASVVSRRRGAIRMAAAAALLIGPAYIVLTIQAGEAGGWEAGPPLSRMVSPAAGVAPFAGGDADVASLVLPGAPTLAGPMNNIGIVSTKSVSAQDIALTGGTLGLFEIHGSHRDPVVGGDDGRFSVGASRLLADGPWLLYAACGVLDYRDVGAIGLAASQWIYNLGISCGDGGLSAHLGGHRDVSGVEGGMIDFVRGAPIAIGGQGTVVGPPSAAVFSNTIFGNGISDPDGGFEVGFFFRVGGVDASGDRVGDVGSCCLANGFCCDSNNIGVDAGCDETVISSQGSCEGAGGTWNGIATDCSTDCCVQDPTGATVCSGAVDHPLDISGACAPDGDGGFTCPSASATYTGDTRGITNGICSVTGLPCATNNLPVPGGSATECDSDISGDECEADEDWCGLLGSTTGVGGGDPVYFEKFSINQDANVTIEYCGTGFCPGQDPGPGPNGGVGVRFTIILPSCQEDGPDTCGTNDAIPFDPNGSQNLDCDDVNTIDFYADVPGPEGAGFKEYWYPIFSGKTCSLTANSCLVNTDCQEGETCDNNALNYQLRITATALATGACCGDPNGVLLCSDNVLFD